MRCLARLFDPPFLPLKATTSTLRPRQVRFKRWWCSSLITDRELQGKGYAKALVKKAFEKVAEEGGFLGLATLAPINVSSVLFLRTFLGELIG